MGWLEDTRASYDTVAESYRAIVLEMFDDIVVERGMLSAFAGLVGGGPVADIGCGPGDITALLAGMGLHMVGIDLSPGMLVVARRNHLEIGFLEGDMAALPLPDGALAGLVSWWSTVHLPAAVLPGVLAESARVLRPGGHLLVGFHAGNEVRRRTSAYGGHPVTLDIYLRPPADIVDAAVAAGLDLAARLDVEPTRTGGAVQCCLLFRQPG